MLAATGGQKTFLSPFSIRIFFFPLLPCCLLFHTVLTVLDVDAAMFFAVVFFLGIFEFSFKLMQEFYLWGKSIITTVIYFLLSTSNVVIAIVFLHDSKLKSNV